MPDIFLVLVRRWSLMLLLVLAGTAAAFVASLLSPKLYLGVTTALPANPLLNDKARIFNQNIEGLYPELGGADELDKMEGTAKLDTLFLAVAAAHQLPAYYNLDTTASDALEKAAVRLKKSSDISKTGYGELKIKVWDKNNVMAATLANALLQTLNAIYERLQTENNKNVLQRLKDAYAQKLQEINHDETLLTQNQNGHIRDTEKSEHEALQNIFIQQQNRAEELKQYAMLINEYDLVVKTTPKVLLVVEQARPSPWYDRPKTSQNVMLAFLASLLFSFLLAVLVESRKATA